jgi:hypothetical protein
MGFARQSSGGELPVNIIEGDFLDVPERLGIDELLNLPAGQRDEIETTEAKRLAKLIVERLDLGEPAVRARIESGRRLAERMSWEHVVNDFFLPALSRAAQR